MWYKRVYLKAMNLNNIFCKLEWQKGKESCEAIKKLLCLSRSFEKVLLIYFGYTKITIIPDGKSSEQIQKKEI